MTWLSATGHFFYYLFLPVTTFLSWLLVGLAPFLHLGTYALYGFLLPIRFLSKFETLYIYFGVAALIGLLTGFILHVSSNMLVSLFNLRLPSEDSGRTAASVRAAREQQKLEEAWQTSSLAQINQSNWKSDETINRDYLEWIDKERGNRRDGQGLLSQTILEEDDDSEDGF